MNIAETAIVKAIGVQRKLALECQLEIDRLEKSTEEARTKLKEYQNNIIELEQDLNKISKK